MTTIAILHPGAMGAVVGGLLVGRGYDVRWVSANRSAASASRAHDAGLQDVGTVAALAAACDAIVSVCPPASAREVAASVAATGFAGVYLDANAIAPATTRAIDATVTEAGATFVDGGIVGGPPREPGTTRLYLSGDHAGEVAAWFDGTALQAIVLDGDIGSASALKAAFAGWTKGSAALLLALRAFARAEGVDEALLEEWATSLPDVRERSERIAATIHRKAWRFAGELQEIGDALDDDGLPGGFHHAAAELYGRLASLKDDPEDQDPAVVLDLLRPPPS